jgi:adenylate cyclase
VFGIDMPIKNMLNYIEDIKITKNSNLFVASDDGYQFTNKHDKMVLSHVFSEIRKQHGKASDLSEDLMKTLKRESFDKHRKEYKNLFIFSFGGDEYISVYSHIASFSEHKWSICIITPVNDINEKLRKNTLIWLFFIIATILIGAILTSIFSSSLSRPIKKLAEDANLICQLRLGEVKQTISRIKEISTMSESFTQMKNAISSFQRYMPIALVKKLIISGKVATVGGENKELTLMFTDIQNFTSLSENIDPQELMEYLSRYFQVITRIVIDSNGTVDKYIGDGMMAFWGAPVDDNDHALHACLAALKIQEALQKLNQEYQKENKPTIVTRIGINTGNVVVGNVGSDDRLNYTSLGDSVNLTSRLEGINKIYGTTIIVSEYTYDQIKDKFKFRFLDRILVKGKHKGIYIYELLSSMELKLDAKLTEYSRDFQIAFVSYEKGEWQKALDLFYILNNNYSSNKVIKIFIARCLNFLKNQPDNIDGVWVNNQERR